MSISRYENNPDVICSELSGCENPEQQLVRAVVALSAIVDTQKYQIETLEKKVKHLLKAVS